jgi:hypothetical protein
MSSLDCKAFFVGLAGWSKNREREHTRGSLPYLSGYRVDFKHFQCSVLHFEHSFSSALGGVHREILEIPRSQLVRMRLGWFYRYSAEYPFLSSWREEGHMR